MVSNQDGGTRLEVFLSFHHETDVDNTTCEVVEAPRDDIEDVEPAACKAHANRTDHTPYGADSEGGEVETDANIVACDGVSVRKRLEGEDRERDVDERLDDAGQDGHGKGPRRRRRWGRDGEDGDDGELQSRQKTREGEREVHARTNQDRLRLWHEVGV